MVNRIELQLDHLVSVDKDDNLVFKFETDSQLPGFHVRLQRQFFESFKLSIKFDQKDPEHVYAILLDAQNSLYELNTPMFFLSISLFLFTCVFMVVYSVVSRVFIRKKIQFYSQNFLKIHK